MSPIDMFASVPSHAAAIMLALVALAFLAYAPALMAPTPLGRILRAIRRLDGARAGSFTLTIGGTTLAGCFKAGRNADDSVLDMDVMRDNRSGRFSWGSDGVTLVDGCRLTARETRGRIEAGACGEAWMQALLAVVRDGRLRLGAAVRAFVSTLGERVSDVRRAATRFVLAGPWRDGVCDMNAFGLGIAGTAQVRIGDGGIIVDTGDDDGAVIDWMVTK